MPLLLFHGDNALEIGESLHNVRRRFNAADVLTFDGATLSLPALSEACRTAGLFDPERLVVVHDLHDRLKGAKKDSAEADEVRRIFQDVAPTTTLLLLSQEMPADSPLLAVVKSAGGDQKAFITPKKGDLPRWIMMRAKTHEASIQRDAAELLAELIGGNSVMLESEIQKLAIYADGDTITVATVDALVGQVTQETIFALVDAIAAGNAARAFSLLHAQLREASSTPTDVALYVIRMLTRQVRILLRIHLAQESGKQKAQIIADLKLPRYFADRYFTQARRLSQGQLMGSFERLASLDHALKSGRADAATGLDLLVAEMCA